MLSRRLNVPFLLTSGYAERDTGEGIDLGAGVPFLPKPWTPVALATRIRELLERRRA